MCYSAFRAAPFAHSDVPICLGKEGAQSYRERPYGIRTNRFPFTRRIYVTTGKPEIMDWMSSETRDPRHTARAPTPHTATLFNVLAKVNLFAQARIETSKAVPCVIYNPRNLVEIANIRYYVARSRSALPIFVRTTETRTHQRKRREGSGG